VSRFEIVAGDFGRGRGRYDAGIFTLPKGSPRAIEDVVSVESNATILERSWLGAAAGGLKGAAIAAPLGMMATIFASPIKAIVTGGPAAITAGAIGAGIGALGGGTKNKALMQVAFRDGAGLVAIAEEHLPDRILEHSELAIELLRRQARMLRDATPRAWFGWRKAEAPTLPALPPPPEITVSAAAGVLLTSAGSALSNGAGVAVDAASATADVAGVAWNYAYGLVRRD
jgi:hypothetical protein